MNTNAGPGPIPSGTSHDAHGTQDEGDEDLEPMDAQLGNPRDQLEPQDWEELEERFAARMKECQAREEELGREFGEWVEVRSGLSTFYFLYLCHYGRTASLLSLLYVALHLGICAV